MAIRIVKLPCVDCCKGELPFSCEVYKTENEKIVSYRFFGKATCLNCGRTEEAKEGVIFNSDPVIYTKVQNR